MFTQCYEQYGYEQHGFWQKFLAREGFAGGLYNCEGRRVRVKRKARDLNDNTFVFNPQGVTVITAANSQSATVMTAAPSVGHIG